MSLAEGFADLKEKCADTDAYIIFYDSARPQTIAIYNGFIKDIIRTKRKAVRVVGLKPSRMNASIRRKSQRCESVMSAEWGAYHKTLINKKESESEMRLLYKDIAAELLADRKISTKKRPTRLCSIL